MSQLISHLVAQFSSCGSYSVPFFFFFCCSIPMSWLKSPVPARFSCLGLLPTSRLNPILRLNTHVVAQISCHGLFFILAEFLCCGLMLMFWGWSGGAKVLCILHHRGVQLILAYSWARPAILVVGKGRGGMFLFLLFLHFHSCSSFFPVPLFHLLYSLFYLFSPFLWETTQNDPQGLTCR